MRKIIKPIKNRWILILLLVFICSSMMGQVQNIDTQKVTIPWREISAVISPEHDEYGSRAEIEIIIGQIAGPILGIGNPLNDMKVNVELIGQIPISSTGVNFDIGSLNSAEMSNFNFFINSLFNSYGYSWGIGDSGSYDYTVPVTDSGGGSGGGSTIYDCPNPPVCSAEFILTNCTCVRKPCNTQLKTEINTLANNTTVKTQILALQKSAKTESFERSTRIDKNPTTSILTSPGLGDSGTPNSVPLSVGSTTIMTIHSHVYNELKKHFPVHSAQDLYNQYELYKDHNNIKFNMTVSPTHAYMLVTEDIYKQATFIKENPVGETVDPDKGGFKKGSDAEKLFLGVYDRLRKQGENYISARASALAYLIEYYDTGLALYESLINADGSTDFHHKRTNIIVTPAQAATETTAEVPETKSYTNNDCP